jgi:hypothetical protein
LGTLALQAIDGSMYWDTQYGALFVRYNDGTDAQWVMVNGNNIQTGTLDFPPAVPGATYAAPNGLTYTYDSAKGVWTCPAGAQLGLGLALDGQFIKVSIPTASTPPTIGTAFNQAMVGSLYWDDVLSQLFIRYDNGGNPTWVAAAPSAGSLAAATLAEAQAGTINLKYSSPETAVPKNASGMTGSAYLPAGNTAARPAANAYIGQFRYNTQIPQLEYSDGVSWIAAGAQAATLAEAAAGTLTTKYLSPETGVPKNGPGMAGAALIPGGNDAARPSPVTGMFRYNNQSGTPVKLEYYDGAAWSPVGSTAGLGLVLDGSALKVSLPVASTPPTVGGGVAQAVNGSMYWDDTLGQLFIRYINGGTPAWVAAAPPAGGSVSAASLAEAAAGTVSTKYSSPQTAVPKDASGMTGAALIPGGNDGARPGTPVTGMLRYNNQGGTPVGMEYYDGTAWASAVPLSGAKIFAWVNFNGGGASPTIRQSVNVSSVTRTSTGEYTINFTTPYYNGTNDYCVSCCVADARIGTFFGKVLTTGGFAGNPSDTTPTYAAVGFGNGIGSIDPVTFYASFIG